MCKIHFYIIALFSHDAIQNVSKIPIDIKIVPALLFGVTSVIFLSHHDLAGVTFHHLYIQWESKYCFLSIDKIIPEMLYLLKKLLPI